MLCGMEQTMIALGEDYCTVPWAAELAGVSLRTVRRAISNGTLATVKPRTGSRESDRTKTLLHTVQVREWHRARKWLTPDE
jgi:excisionase family DNA binding protein